MWFIAYFVASLPSAWLIERVGYQRAMVTGLIIMAAGALLMIPAAHIPSYVVVLSALFVIASGITLLQVAANPYVAVVGPAQTAPARLNLVQAFNSLGTTLAPLFGGYLILGRSVSGTAAPGARSLTMAERLPDTAFLSRDGQRIVEQGRYHLDLRDAAAVAHLDSVIDRLVDDVGIGYFKLDYNINPGAGTDRDAPSIGAGLLDHNRAHLAWLDSVLDRHPGLILENCASGAMRMDFAMLSRLQLQSTSDQQDAMHYPPIAASAPMSMTPEQAANWAYPQPSMSDEEIAFTLATAVLGRFYLSGWIDQMTESQLELVRAAVRLNRELVGTITTGFAFWPLGLPRWDAPHIAFGLAPEPYSTETSRFVTIWNRSEESQESILQFPDLIGADVTVRTVFPTNLIEWTTHWDRDTGTLRVRNPTPGIGARILSLAPARAES